MKQNQPSFRRFLRLLIIDGICILLLRLLMGIMGCSIPEAPNQAANADVKASQSVVLPIVMYHSIRTGPESDYAITPETLESDLQYLKAHGYQSVSPEEIIAYVQTNAALPEHPILLTFDDGFYNNLSYALPLLERYDMCATINVVGTFTQYNAVQDSHIPAYSYLTVDDLSELLASRRITLGNHTNAMHHQSPRQGCRILPEETESLYHDRLYADLSYLQAFLTQQLHITPIVFAYPYGFDCQESIPVLKELGFLMTLTCYEYCNIITSDSDSLYGLGRYNRAGNQSSAAFFAKTSQDRENRRIQTDTAIDMELSV